MASRRPMRPSRGLTLVETMAAAAIVAVLASVAFPSYRDARLRSQRADATAALQTLQAAQERLRARTGAYARTAAELPGFGDGRSPQGHFQIELQGRADGLAYTLTARAQGEQADDSACTTVTLRVEGALSFHGPEPRCWFS